MLSATLKLNPSCFQVNSSAKSLADSRAASLFLQRANRLNCNRYFPPRRLIVSLWRLFLILDHVHDTVDIAEDNCATVCQSALVLVRAEAVDAIKLEPLRHRLRMSVENEAIDKGLAGVAAEDEKL